MSEKDPTIQNRPGLRERKKIEARHAMHRAALELVAERGLADVTVDQMAERAGVSPRTLFNYWGSKEGAVLGMMPSDNESLIECLKSRPKDEPPKDTMRALLTLQLTNATPDRSLRTLKRNVLRREPQLSQVFMNRNNDVQRTLISIMQERLEDEFGSAAHDIAAMYIFWCFSMSRAVYAVSMKRNIDLLDALPIVLSHLDSGDVSFV